MMNKNIIRKCLFVILLLGMFFVVVDDVAATYFPEIFAPGFHMDINNYEWEQHLTKEGNIFKSKFDKPIDFKFENGWYWSPPNKNSWTHVSDGYPPLISFSARPNRGNRFIIDYLSKRERFLSEMSRKIRDDDYHSVDYFKSIKNDLVLLTEERENQIIVFIKNPPFLIGEIDVVWTINSGNCELKNINWHSRNIIFNENSNSCEVKIKFQYDQDTFITLTHTFNHNYELEPTSPPSSDTSVDVGSDSICGTQIEGKDGQDLSNRVCRDPNDGETTGDSPNDCWGWQVYTNNISQACPGASRLCCLIEPQTNEETDSEETDETEENGETEETQTPVQEGSLRCNNNILQEYNGSAWEIKKDCSKISNQICKDLEENQAECDYPLCKDCFTYGEGCQCPSHCINSGILEQGNNCGGIDIDFTCTPLGGQCKSEANCEKDYGDDFNPDVHLLAGSDCIQRGEICCKIPSDGNISSIADCGSVCNDPDGCICPEACLNRAGSKLSADQKVPSGYTCLGFYRDDPNRATRCNNQQKDGICPPGCFWWNDLDCGRDSNIFSLLWDVAPDSWKDWYYDGAFVQGIRSFGLMFDINHWAETICNPLVRRGLEPQHDGYFISHNTHAWISGLRDLYNETHLVYSMSYYITGLREENKFRIELKGNNIRYKFPREDTLNATLKNNEYWFNITSSETKQDSRISLIDTNIYYNICLIFDEEIIFNENLAHQQSVKEVCRSLNDIWD